MNNYLEIKNISKTFNTSKKLRVLKNLSFNFSKGKIYSLMGPSGSGKSTLLNLISLIDKPTSGSINFNQSPIDLIKIIKMIFLEQKKLELFINKIICFLILRP